MTLRVLAFDVATITGCAFGVAGGHPRAWELDLGKRSSDQERFSKAIGLARWACAKFEPDLVAIEAPIGSRNSSQILIGLWACMTGEIRRAGISPIKCDISSVRKHFLGRHLTSKHFPHLTKAQSRLEIKRSVMARCRALGWEAETDNCGDALATWDYACALNSPNHHITTIGGLFNEHG